MMRVVRVVLYTITACLISLSSASAANCPTNGPPSNATWRFTTSFPPGCNGTACSYFLGVRTNEDPLFLDFMMEGKADGWIAVGYTPNQGMSDADVFVCALIGAQVTILDTYNIPNAYSNVVDSSQDLCPSSKSSVNGRIRCVFSRAIKTNDMVQDKDLNQSYYQLNGWTDAPGSSLTLIAYHSRISTPLISTSKLNPTTASTVTAASVVNCPTNGPPSNATWRFTTSFPPGCNGTACSYFLGVRTNENPLFLDFMMEGKADGWIAVGYTPNQGMPDADVFVCALIGGQVTILDTYNIPIGRSNVVDSNQDLCPSSMSVVNGRIRCVFSRAIKTNDMVQDKDLNQSYYQLNGWTDATGSSLARIASHGSTIPLISCSKLNPTTAVSVCAGTANVDPLIRAHGILMIVTWPVLAVTGIFFAAWMKPALPKAEWFQVHRAAMLASLFLGCVAFLFIFVAKRGTRGLVSFVDPTTIAHFAIGIIVMALHILNPIISAFRCIPTHPRRWLFNLVHGTFIGLGVELLALTNVGIGLALFGNRLNLVTVASPLAVYLAYVAFLMTLIGALFFIYTVIAITTGSPPLGPSVLKPLLALIAPSSPVPTKTEVVIELADKDGVDTKTPPEKPPAKPPSKDAPLRWAGLAIFLIVMVPLMLAVIILIAAL